MANPCMYKHLASVLAEDIVKGRWTSDSSLPPTRQLARELGVSQPTAIKTVRLLADYGIVAVHAGRPATVLSDGMDRAAKLLSHTEDPAVCRGRRTSDSTATRVALLIPDIDWPLKNPALVSLHHRLTRLEAKSGLHFETVVWPLKKQVRSAVSLAAEGYAAAVCLSLRGVYLAGLLALKSRGIPALIINRQFDHPDLVSVTADDYKPSWEVATRLARMGHRNICMVADLLATTQSTVHAAICGWLDALNEAGVLRACSHPVYLLPDLPLLKRNSRVFETLFCRSDRPTAIFFYLPIWANVFLRHPTFAQLRVPEDISVILGMAGERPITLPGCPPLCTLDFDYGRYAECIIEIVLGLIKGQHPTRRLLIPLKWHLTESIGPPPRVVRAPIPAGDTGDTGNAGDETASAASSWYDSDKASDKDMRCVPFQTQQKGKESW